jgi:hypothetical protein
VWVLVRLLGALARVSAHTAAPRIHIGFCLGLLGIMATSSAQTVAPRMHIKLHGFWLGLLGTLARVSARTLWLPEYTLNCMVSG